MRDLERRTRSGKPRRRAAWGAVAWHAGAAARPLGIACTEDDLLDPQANLDAAAHIFATQGPGAWSQSW